MRISYFSHSRLKNSVNAVYIKGLIQNGCNLETYKTSQSVSGYFGILKTISSNKPDLIMVGYDSPQLVIFCRLFTRKKIIYNALCSVYERLIISRALARPFSPRAIYYWLIDFLAVNLANLVMVETDSQVEYFRKLFWAKQKKLFRAWTGADEDIFYYNQDVKKFPIFTAIFRGQFLPESGVEYVVYAAKILENESINFIIHGGGQNIDKIKKLIEKLNPRNIKLTTDFLPAEELRTLMQKCHLSLGQLSNHPRLERTIPHKCYESLAMRLPYLTTANKGIFELLKDGETCITCEPENAESLAGKILWAKNHPQELERITEKGRVLYKDKLSSRILAKKLLAHIILK